MSLTHLARDPIHKRDLPEVWNPIPTFACRDSSSEPDLTREWQGEQLELV